MDPTGTLPVLVDAPLKAKHFRLFRFLKSTRPDPPASAISIEIKTFKIRRAPTYEAISYCWGDKSDGVAFIQRRQDQGDRRGAAKPLEVWINLHDCLRRLWREQHADADAVARPSPWFWNDAICIEQGTHPAAVEEKEQQIALMETIFALARPVRAWLGDASTEEEQAFMQIAEVCASLTAHKIPYEDRAKLPARTDVTWRYWSQVMIRPWFTRAWIVQEAIIGGNGDVIIMLGAEAEASWKTFVQIVERTTELISESSDHYYKFLDERAKKTVGRDYVLDWGVTLEAFEQNYSEGLRDMALRYFLERNLANIWHLIFIENEEFSTESGILSHLIMTFANRKCTYDQDRPNAMKGLLPKDLKRNWKYHRSDADLGSVYRDVTRLWLSNDPTLSLLQRVMPADKFLPQGSAHRMRDSDLVKPSWAINLANVVVEILSGGTPHQADGFHAGLVQRSSLGRKSKWAVPGRNLLDKTLHSNPNVSFPTEDECHIVGAFLGKVETIVSTDAEEIRELVTVGLSAAAKRILHGYLRRTLEIVESATDGKETAKETYWRSLILDRADVHQPELRPLFDMEDEHSRVKEYESLMKRVDVSEGRDDQNDDPGQLDDDQSEDATQRYLRQVRDNSRGFPNWFVISTRHVGRSFAVPEEGDVLAVLYGAVTPIMLRQVEGRDVYEFMGEAYVHGVMQGEALLKENRKKFPKTTFKLV